MRRLMGFLLFWLPGYVVSWTGGEGTAESGTPFAECLTIGNDRQGRVLCGSSCCSLTLPDLDRQLEFWRAENPGGFPRGSGRFSRCPPRWDPLLHERRGRNGGNALFIFPFGKGRSLPPSWIGYGVFFAAGMGDGERHHHGDGVWHKRSYVIRWRALGIRGITVQHLVNILVAAVMCGWVKCEWATS